MRKIKLLCMLTVAVFLSACSEEVSETSTAPVAEVEITQTMYKEEYIDFTDDMSSPCKMGYVSNSGVRLVYSDKNGVFKYADYDENMQVKSSVVLFSAENIYNTFFSINSDGNIFALVIYVQSDSEPGSEDYFRNADVTFEIRHFSSTGEQESVVEVRDINSCFDISSDFIQNFTKVNDKYLIRLSDRQLIVETDGSISDNQEVSGNVCYCTDSNGNIVTAGMKGYSYIDEISVANDSDMTAYGDYLILSQGIATGYDGFKVFFMLNDGVYGLTESDEVVQIMDYNKSLMSSGDYYEVVYAGKGRFMAIGNDDGLYLSVMNVRPDGYVMNREKVVVGTCYPENSNPQTLASKYNKKSDSYTIEIKGYKDFDALKLDVLAGSPPDMYEFLDCSEMHRLVNAGALADMYGLSEQYGGFTKDDIMDNVIQAFEYKDGLYMMSQAFGVNYTLGNKEYFPDGRMTYDEFFDIVNNAPEGVYLGNRIDCGTREYIFNNFCTYNLNRWIDTEKTECYFDTPEFVSLLEFVQNVSLPLQLDRAELQKNTTQDEYQLVWEEECMTFKKGTSLTVSGNFLRIRDITDLQVMYGLETDDFTFIYPFNDGAGEVYGTDYYSIFADGNCVDGAWDYMNYLLSDNLLVNYLQTKSSFVTRKESLYKIIEKEQEKSENPIVVDANGITHDYGYPKPITDDEIDLMLEYISSCTSLKGSYNVVGEIVQEEYADYSAGDITAEECGQRIQNRVSIYLSENS